MVKVNIILLNWNGWMDTIQCLETIFKSSYKYYRVIVCDNQSTDDSLEKIKEWAEGNLEVKSNLNIQLNHLLEPIIKKPIRYIYYDQEEAENGGKREDEEFPLVLIQNKTNSGYSAGNNVGLRYSLKKKVPYVWLLNNDTLITPNTLEEQLIKIQKNEKIGLMGSYIYFAQEPHKVQTFGGGKIYPLLGIDRFAKNRGDINYVSGTSLFIRVELMKEIGLLDERYFFYWEDVDYCFRALQKNWQISVAEKSIVYHKFSASVGAQSLKSDLYKVRSIKYFFKKNYKLIGGFPILINISGMIVYRLLRRQFNRIIPILKAILKKEKIV